MTWLAEDALLGGELARLDPFLTFALERAAGFAARYHAESLTVEHLLASLLEDEECAATRTVLHAFADPETIAVEAIALAPGIMVVSSDRCIPFSHLGVRVLEAARAAAAQRGHSGVGPEHLFLAAIGELDAELGRSLGEAGWTEEDPCLGLERAEDPVPASGPVLKRFTQAARRGLSAAGRVADRLERRSISPAHVVVGSLEVSPELVERSGLSANRASLVLAGRDADENEPPVRPLPVDEELREHLVALPSGGGTGSVLARLVEAGSEELRALLARQKITTALVEHARGAFRDPAPPTTNPS